ncbi:methylmalonyl-CoA mutase family protein, partial [Spirosoma areae]
MTTQQPKLSPSHPQPFTHKIRLVTAASLFDGHDAAINLMRRLMQASGAEVIHLGHNRSVAEIVDCAIQEDVQGIAVTSYQGGHLEFFKYMHDLLNERGAGHIKLFGGGGGTILPAEIAELHAYGITRIYSPDDGRAMGLQGMIDDLLRQCDFELPPVETRPFASPLRRQIPSGQETRRVASLHQTIARLITTAENHPDAYQTDKVSKTLPVSTPVLGITGTGGAGKSSLVDELVLRFLRAFPDKTLAIISVDPSKRKTGGALLGDRIRMNAITPSAGSPVRVYMRSLATRQSNLALSRHVQDAIDVCKAAQFDLIIVETSGIGQSDTEITEHSDKALYVMTADYGAATQLEKIDMLDFADVIAINKFDKRGSLDALRDVRKQYRRNHNLWEVPDDELPIVGTIASQFNDAGMNALFERLMVDLGVGRGAWSTEQHPAPRSPLRAPQAIIPPDRVRYLAEIVEESRRYAAFVNEQTTLARQLYQVDGVMKILGNTPRPPEGEVADAGGSPFRGPGGEVQALYTDLETRLHPDCRTLLNQWPHMQERYTAEFYEFKVRDKIIRQALYSETLSHLKIPKVSLPKYHDWGDVLRWLLTENVPGEFPYTAGVFPLKREGEDPTRMFAGEGGPERTNRRFHYVSKGLPAKRLSTAFDSVTLYGEDPALRPDIFGKVGNSGVSICTLDDAKKLYSGFDLCDPATSVSMTINGPAPMLLAFFLNAAIDQQCEKWLRQQGAGSGGPGVADARGLTPV